MKINIISVLVFLILTGGCASRKVSPVINNISEKRAESVKINFWLDEETNTVHKFVSENGTEKVTSIIKYRDGAVLEVMKVIISQYNNNGQFHWVYFVPSTKYIVELNSESISDNSINIKWTNRTADGSVKSGTDILVRCNENGMIADKN